MCRRLLSVLVFLGVLVTTSDITWAEKKEAKQYDAAARTDYVDMSIRLIVVEKDEINGKPIVPGNAQRMRVVGEPIEAGGVVKLWTEDGKPCARIVNYSRNPIVWFVSQAQADLIVHDGPISWTLVQGSEGSGKTTVLAMWTAFRVLEHIGHNREIGLTAPTHGRMAHVKKKIADHWPPRWYRFSVRDQRYTFLAGPTVQLASAAQKSGEGGSPFQGFSWVAQGGDEYQDHFKYDGDLVARGREASAVGIPYKRLETSTFKDAPAWRTFRSVADAARIPVNSNVPDGEQQKLWHLTLLLGLESPFIGADHWHKMRAGLTDREYARRVLAQDVGPERQLYYSWKRTIVANDNGQERKLPGNLRALPLGAVDVTKRELANFGLRDGGLLLGHDPGKRQHVTEFLKAYEFKGDRRIGLDGRRLPPLVRWFVVDEVTTAEATIETHIARVLERCRTKWNCQGLDRHGRPSDTSTQALVRIDPHTTTGDEHPDSTVYSQWRNAGFLTKAAAYSSKTGKPTPIKVEARIDLMNTLLCNTEGERCLFVLMTERGEPVAPKLVAAFEQMERNESGKAEWENKDASDLSHWPASVCFAVFAIEKPRVDALRARAA
jgi:antitoxin (DNA-binding transcriptional repressor) of toxin-antitoxin stability system